VQQRLENGEECVGNDFGAFDGGVYAVLLDGAGNVDEVFVQHGYEGRMVLRREIAEGLIEGVDVVRAVIGRQGDAGEQNLDVSRFKGG